MKTITLHTIIFLLLSFYSIPEILGQPYNIKYDSHHDYLTLSSISSYPNNLQVNHSFIDIDNPDILLHKINLSVPGHNKTSNEFNLRSYKNFDCSGLKNQFNINNLVPLNLPVSNTECKEAGKIIGRFFLGALAGAASAGIAIVVMAQEPEGPLENPAAWIIGGAVVGGILFVIDW